MNVIEGVVAAPNARVVIAIARFNHYINNSLLHGAVDALKRIGQVKDQNITVVWVPGAYELPLAVSALANSKKYDAVVALGTVIRGGTAHFEFVAGECSAGLSAVAARSALPVAFGVLTTESIEQAIERAGTKAGNKGAEAALTALEMINAIYSWQLAHNNIADIEVQFLAEQDTSDVDVAYFRKLYGGAATNAQELDKLIVPCLSRQLKKLSHVERVVFRIALFKLRKRHDVPYKVAINEAIEVFKTLGAEESLKLINGVLDKVAPEIRLTENSVAGHTRTLRGFVK